MYLFLSFSTGGVGVVRECFLYFSKEATIHSFWFSSFKYDTAVYLYNPDSKPRKEVFEI